MNEAFDGASSANWIEPFGSFLLERGVLDKTSLERALRLWPALDTRLGWLAVARNQMTANEVYAVLALSQDREALFGELAIELGTLNARDVADLLTLQQSPFRLFVHCLQVAGMLDEPTISDQLSEFAEYEGLVPPCELTCARRAASPLTGVPEWQRYKEWVWQRIERMGTLAMIPEARELLLARLARGPISCNETTQLISSDPCLLAQLLRMTCSAVPGVQIRSIAEAVGSLGSAAARQLVLTPATLGQYVATSVEPARKLWTHNQRCAIWCELLSEELELEGDVLLHSLLHDIGLWTLLQSCPSECERVRSLTGAQATSEQAERLVFGTTRADIGAYVCRHWSLPESVVEAALHHATPAVLLAEIPSVRPTTRLVHAACRISQATETGSLADLDPAFLEYHSLDLDAVETLAQAVESRLSGDD